MKLVAIRLVGSGVGARRHALERPALLRTVGWWLVKRVVKLCTLNKRKSFENGSEQDFNNLDKQRGA